MISIHALHAERVWTGPGLAPSSARFQSTRSMRSASSDGMRVSSILKKFQSTRSMRSASDHFRASVLLAKNFNPRAPCGARLWYRTGRLYTKRFQSTRSMRSASYAIPLRDVFRRISIHALHAERVRVDRLSTCFSKNFNPRAPCGARPPITQFTLHHKVYFNPRAPCGARRTPTDVYDPEDVFQSTRSMRSASDKVSGGNYRNYISIHALHAERVRCKPPDDIRIRFDFNPRAPCGARPGRRFL